MHWSCGCLWQSRPSTPCGTLCEGQQHTPHHWSCAVYSNRCTLLTECCVAVYGQGCLCLSVTSSYELFFKLFLWSSPAHTHAPTTCTCTCTHPHSELSTVAVEAVQREQLVPVLVSFTQHHWTLATPSGEPHPLVCHTHTS